MVCPKLAARNFHHSTMRVPIDHAFRHSLHILKTSLDKNPSTILIHHEYISLNRATILMTLPFKKRDCHNILQLSHFNVSQVSCSTYVFFFTNSKTTKFRLEPIISLTVCSIIECDFEVH